MNEEIFQIQAATPFSESMLWDLNRSYYQEQGIKAWNRGAVPHHMTSNFGVGKTYAKLIFATLKDYAQKNNSDERVYILELGAGHGRLAFHVLKHLNRLVTGSTLEIPDFCYILSDVAEENLAFFLTHTQFQTYYEAGQLDLCYFDAVDSINLQLRKSKRNIVSQSLAGPLIVIANYFFDSIPNELFFIKDQAIWNCKVSMQSEEDPKHMNTEALIKNMELTYTKTASTELIYENSSMQELLENYRLALNESYLFFPSKAIACLERLRDLTTTGIVLLTMDKGFHKLEELQDRKEPEVIVHGSFSLWVNYHALDQYCVKSGGTTLFPSYSNFHLEIACLFFLTDVKKYKNSIESYRQVVDEFGPDDFNTIKHLAYQNVSRLSMKELIALFRLASYDSIFFVKFLPRLKLVAKEITFKERQRLAQTINEVWNMYFDINEELDLAYEFGGISYDLGYYEMALQYFTFSEGNFGEKADTFYNRALCYYQLRKDVLFLETLQQGKKSFPKATLFKSLEHLDMN